MEIRQIILNLLKKYKLTETEICRRCGMNPSQLSRYLNQTGKKDIQVNTLLKIIESFPIDAQSEFWWIMNAQSIKKATIPAPKHNNSLKAVEKETAYSVE